MGFPYYEVPQMVAKIIDHQIYKWKDMDEEEAAALDVIQKVNKVSLKSIPIRSSFSFLHEVSLSNIKYTKLIKHFKNPK